jgi:2'-5' RNA ligase
MFVALPVSPELKGGLAEPARQLASLTALLRLADLDHGHLTLHFLGGVEEERVVDLSSRLRAALAETQKFEVEVKGVGAFPSLSRARVIWAGVEDEGGRLLSLEQSLGRTLTATGFQIEDRPFSPHLTLARTRRPPTASERSELEGWRRRWLGHHFGLLPVETVLLMRSQLGAGPAKHTVVERFGLE